MQRSFDKTIITLRIAMNRIGSIIDEVDDDWIIYETLMQHKRRLHEQIDILIKQRRKII
jgi:ParB family chromosome partitioning protein